VSKGPLALRTISETADIIGVQQHVLRFWETKFPFIRPTKRAGGRRFYRPQDVELLKAVKTLLYDRGYTIRGVQKLFKEHGQKALLDLPEGDAILTEQGLVPAEDAPTDTGPQERAPHFEFGDMTDLERGLRVSEESRERLRDIVRALEEAQETLGRQIGRPGTRSGSGKFS